MLPASVQTIADILGDPITTMRDPRFAGNIGLSVCVEAGLRGTADAYEILETTGSFDRVFYPNRISGSAMTVFFPSIRKPLPL